MFGIVSTCRQQYRLLRKINSLNALELLMTKTPIEWVSLEKAFIRYVVKFYLHVHKEKGVLRQQ